MYGYVGENVFMTIKENDFRNIFSMHVKAKKTKSNVKTYKLSSDIGLNYGCRRTRFTILSRGSLTIFPYLYILI
jgi:hypothetical protein